MWNEGPVRRVCSARHSDGGRRGMCYHGCARRTDHRLAAPTLENCGCSEGTGPDLEREEGTTRSSVSEWSRAPLRTT